MRLIRLFLVLAILVLIPFLLFGDRFEGYFSEEGTRRWLDGFGRWGWLAAIALLSADLILPIPSTVVFTALGVHYGGFAGGVIGSAGFVLGGLIAYGLCRGFGQRVAEKLVGAEDLVRGRALFERSGGWIVAVSRWLPMLPEVVACLAGLTRMPLGRFSLALASGSIPFAFAFAYLGEANAGRPLLALLLSVAIAPVLWFVASRLLRRGC